MKKIELKSRKLLRTIFGSISFTALAFVFQACYGTGPDPFYDIKLTGTVKSKVTNLPIKGIKVALFEEGYLKYNYEFTDKKGNFSFYASVPNREDFYNYQGSMHYKSDSVRVHFLDVDGMENGWFADKMVIINPAHKDEVKINVTLELKP